MLPASAVAAAMVPSKKVPSAAAKVLQARALQCSFSSVFHLRRAGMSKQDADFCENLFIGAVGVPLALTGLAGIVVSWRNQ
jgi:hypothetical protein